MKRVVSIALLNTILYLTGIGHAYEVPFQGQLTGSAIQPAAIIDVADARFGEMQSGGFTFMNARVTDEVRLAIDLKTSNPTSDFTTSVSMLLQYEEWVNDHFVSQSKQISLTVNYSGSGTFKDKAVYRFKNAHKLKITVNQVTGPVAGIVLLGSIQVTRFDQFDPQASLSGSSLHSEFVAPRNELLIAWEAIDGAEEYDLEWTWINDYSSGNAPLSPDRIAIDRNLFRLNSSRVTIVGNEYSIPLLYDRGYILYRVRGIGRTMRGTDFVPIDGSWSYNPQEGHTVANVSTKYLILGHQNNLNWQATISYAEEGKNKAAISYFDGTLRSRQSVSRVNSEDKIIVGETFYDHQGRPGVQVLPVPTNNSRIGYQRSFNLDSNGKPYNRQVFDTSDENCVMESPGMSTLSGASRYYSPDNPDKTGAQAFLPDAKKYPFTQTEYTPDNTGRIRRQSGVGPDHKLGSGHETKYFYGKPAQEELDKMFGADVGYATHYKKNMVVDANGQISVSYLDPQGRVIATSLAGETPENLITIAKPEETVNTVVDLLGKKYPTDKAGTEDNISTDGHTKLITREMLVTQQGTRNFDYSISTGNYQEDCIIGPPRPLCYGCVIDVAVSLTDECGNEVIPFFGTNNSTSRTIGTIDLECANTENQYGTLFQTTGLLEPGNYSLSRKLSINEDALDAYTEDFIVRQEDCILSFDHFLEEEAKNVELFSCMSDCQSCRDAVGDFGKYTGPNCNPCLTLEEYQALLAQCDFLCNDDLVQCVNAYNMMLGDVSPFGQYGEIMKAVSVGDEGAVVVPEGPQEINPNQFLLSIFNENNKLPGNIAHTGNWKFPKDGAYLSENGEPAVVDVVVLIDEDTNATTYSPLIEDGFNPAPGVTLENGDIIQVPPHKLLRVQDFLASWEASWAEQLVHLHPEFAYYTFCNILQSSHEWDTRWLGTESYEEAVQKGFLPNGVLKPSPLTPGEPLSDPYFFEVASYLVTNDPPRNWSNYNQQERLAITRSLNNYADGFDLWNVVHRMVNCPYDDGVSNICQACPAYDGINTDEEWNAFKSMYFSLKQQFVERKTTMYAMANDSYNGCIGSEKYYSPFEYSFYKSNIFSFATTLGMLLDAHQPCNWLSYVLGLYKEKQKRFPLSSDMIDNTGLDLYTCYTGFDENTPSEFTPDQQVACSNSLRDILEESKLEAEIGFYETCGQCPVIFGLQTLIDAVAKRKELDKNNIQLSCYPESRYPEFAGSFQSELDKLFPGNGIWSWNASPLSASRELTVDIRKGALGSCTLKLKIPVGVALSGIETICCINYTSQPIDFPLTGHGNFIMKATVTGRSDKISIEGFITCLDLVTCPFPPRCEPTREASELQTVMNALLFDFTLTNGASDDLFSTSPIALYQPPYQQIIQGTLSSLQQNLSGTNLTWKSVVTGNALIGFIEDGQGGSCLVELRPAIDVPFDVTKIIGFTNIRPDRTHPTDPVKNFLVTAIVETDLGKARIKMSGYSGCINIGSCTPVTVGGN